MSKPLRILYSAGPGDVIKTYNHWINGQDDPSQVSVTYSSQFYEACRDLNAEGYVISSCNEKKLVRDGQFMIEHRPIPLRHKSGLLYYLGQLWYNLHLVFSAVSFGANVAVIINNTTALFVFSLLPLLGVQVIPTLHCVLWRKYVPQSMVERLILKLSRSLFVNGCTAVLTASDDISEQVVQLTSAQHPPLVNFLPTYRRIEFAGLAAPDDNRSPFRVLFAGRLEIDKGVFDLLEITKRFAAQGRQDFTFNICGAGSAQESLRLAAQQAGVDASFVCHGHCNKLQMREMFSQAHVVIVPTRTDFGEGFNQVVVEGVLSGRPVVTSSVCPALFYVRDALVEVPPDDIKGYGDALLKLCDEREFYEEKRRGCLGVQDQFYDISQSWGTALKGVVVAIQDRRE